MIDLNKLKKEQAELAKKISLKDDIGIKEIKTIGGVNQAIKDDCIISAIVVCNYKAMEIKTMEIIEKQYAVEKAKMPYISGFRTYREGAAITAAYAKLSNRPDVMIFYGHGILHPRKIGLASHMGILLDQPSIGIANKTSCGVLKGNKVYIGDEAVGELVETRTHSKPIYVSPGYKMSLKTSVEIVINSMRPPHKLPEPLHLSHRYLKEVINEISNGKKQ